MTNANKDTKIVVNPLERGSRVLGCYSRLNEKPVRLNPPKNEKQSKDNK